MNTDPVNSQMVSKVISSSSWPTSEHTGCPQKFGSFLYAVILSNINHFRNCFTDRIRIKSAIIPSLKMPPHLKCAASLPCEMSLSGTNCCSKKAFHWSLHWSVASRSPAWVHRPAMWTHWTFDIKTAGCDGYFRQ